MHYNTNGYDAYRYDSCFWQYFLLIVIFFLYFVIQLEGVNEPVMLQVFVGNDAGRVKPHGFYQACRVTGRNTTACQEVDVDGTTVIEVSLDPSTNMTLAYVHLPSNEIFAAFMCRKATNLLLLLLTFLHCEDLHPKRLCCPCAAWTVSASWSCATPTSRPASA